MAPIEEGLTLAQPGKLQARPITPTNDVTLAQQLGAAFSLDNSVVSTYNYATRERAAPEEGFDPLANLQPGEEPVAGRFIDARSMAEMSQIRQRIENERELRRRLGDGPVYELLASTLALLSDPLTYLPVFGQAAGGARIGARAVGLGVSTAGQVAAQETILQATQEERPLEDSVAAVLLGGAFGAGIGGAFGVRAASREKLYKAAVEDFQALARGAQAESGRPVPQSLGAAAPAPRLAPEDTLLVSSGGVAEVAAKLDKVGLAAPSVVLATSENAAAREAVHALVDTGMVTKGQVRGLAMSEEGPVDLLVRRHQNTGNMAVGGILKEGFDLHRADGGPMSRAQFSEEVGRALRRGDTSDFPSVAAAAQRLRAEVFEPLKKEAIALKLLPEDVSTETAVSYFTRVYNREKIKANRSDFRNSAMTYLRRVVPLKELASEAEYKEMADAIVDRILGYETGRVPMMNVPRLRGPLKERTFNIPDHMIEDYLVSDVSRVGQFYVNTMVADIQMARLSQRMGFGGRADDVGPKFREKIMEEAKARVDAVDGPDGQKMDAKQKEAARAGIMDKAEREGELAEGLVDLIRGTSRTPMDPSYMGLKRVAKVVRTLNYARLLGSVLLSSIPDMGRVVWEEGLTRTFGTLMADGFNGFKGIRLSRQEAQAAGTANEIFLATRVRAQYDLGERYASESAFERGLDKAGQWFGVATLLTPWNEAMKSVTSALVSTRILGAVEVLNKGGKLSARDVRKLAVAGIDENMARRIAKQAEHFDRHGAVTVANTEAWTDAKAIEAFRSALIRDVDNTVITPGKGDAPLWTSTEWGKTIFQFKRFGAAATQRILIAGLQTRDMAVLNGLMVMVGLGGLATAARDWTTDGEVKKRDARGWAVEALDRSGALAQLYDMDAIADKLTGGNISLQRVAAGQDTERFKSRDIVGQMLGPTVGAVTDTAKAVTGLAEGDLTQADLHRIRRLFPGQNLFYIRHLLDKAESATAARFGLPERSQKQKTAAADRALPSAP